MSYLVVKCGGVCSVGTATSNGPGLRWFCFTRQRKLGARTKDLSGKQNQRPHQTVKEPRLN